MDAEALFAVAFAVETAAGMDMFFRPDGHASGADFPLGGNVSLRYRLQSQSTTVYATTLQFIVSSLGVSKENHYIWIHNYRLATAKACQRALVAALRMIASSGQTFHVELDAREFM
ncbi:hypothetical protein BC629DRAFT_1589151 [Irpex lacteus]|nr:hypothetical protein BC629DRAFT_1589151 [Irpex lacteus]